MRGVEIDVMRSVGSAKTSFSRLSCAGVLRAERSASSSVRRAHSSHPRAVAHRHIRLARSSLGERLDALTEFDRAIVLAGGWQTSKETAYIQATRARHGTDWYLARDQLGEEGQDPDRIMRLARDMSRSRAHTPSVIHREIPGPSWDPSRDPLHLSRLIPHVGRLMPRPARDTPDREIGRGR
jgi:hypothetical protein